MKRNEAKRSKTKRNETKRNEANTKRRNEMPRAKKANKADVTTEAKSSTVIIDIVPERISLGALLSEQKTPTQAFRLWIVGDTPLICHAWSQKAKLDMLRGQAGATQTAKEKRKPEEDFKNSLYQFPGKDIYGFPITAVKRAVLSCAHKDRGVPRSDVMQALWLDAEIVQTRTAHPGTCCDLPLVRIYGSPPIMREDMVRIGAGLRKTANLAYRAQFTTWALRVTGDVNPLVLETHQLGFLFRSSGTGIGVGDWRNEKGGWFGSYHIANVAEEEAWEKFATGKGPLPKVKVRRSERAEITQSLAEVA
jgi:hypothetical protein